MAPTTDIFAVRSDGEVRRLEQLHWGLVPFWAKDPSVGNRMINARAESLAEKSAYKRAFRKRRCIIPADGFYEWTAVPGQKKKQPMYIQRVRRRAAGLRRALGGLAQQGRTPTSSCSRARSSPARPTRRSPRSTTACR